MTINELQRELIEEIEGLTKDMSLINSRGGCAELKGYPQAVPILPVFEAMPIDGEEEKFQDEDGVFPYFIVRIDGVEYKKGEEEKNQAHMIIMFAIHDADPEMRGYFTLTAIMERVAARFQSDTVLGAYWCEREMNAAYQEDDTFPQFFGALEMTWNLPDIGINPRMEKFYG